jgi:hypothetical protein
MSFEEKFRKQISDFQRYGTYTYEFDEVGNVVLNPASSDFSEVFVAFPLSNFVYEKTKLIGFYDPTFTEFIPNKASEVTPEVEQLQSEVQTLESKNLELNNRLDALISINESMPSSADTEASKQVILELRKSLGEGRVDSDFSEDFPYTPIKKAVNIAEQS